MVLIWYQWTLRLALTLVRRKKSAKVILKKITKSTEGSVPDEVFQQVYALRFCDFAILRFCDFAIRDTGYGIRDTGYGIRD